MKNHTFKIGRDLDDYIIAFETLNIPAIRGTDLEELISQAHAILESLIRSEMASSPSKPIDWAKLKREDGKDF